MSIEDANREVKNIAQDLDEQYPEQRKGWGIKLIPLRQQLLGDITGTIRPTLLLLMGVVGFLLLITCTNVATLLLTISLERKYETAIQLALGANRKRLVSPVAHGRHLALIARRYYRFVIRTLCDRLVDGPQARLFLRDERPFQQVPISGTVLAFTFGVSLLTGIVFVLAPAAFVATSDNLVADLGRVVNAVASARKGGARSSF